MALRGIPVKIVELVCSFDYFEINLFYRQAALKFKLAYPAQDQNMLEMPQRGPFKEKSLLRYKLMALILYMKSIFLANTNQSKQCYLLFLLGFNRYSTLEGIDQTIQTLWLAYLQTTQNTISSTIPNLFNRINFPYRLYHSELCNDESSIVVFSSKRKFKDTYCNPPCVTDKCSISVKRWPSPGELYRSPTAQVYQPATYTYQ